MPVPREIFDALDKFAHSNWRSVQRPELAERRPRGDQADTALLLGVVIAEGFIAVEAKDAAEVKSVGRDRNQTGARARGGRGSAPAQSQHRRAC